MPTVRIRPACVQTCGEPDWGAGGGPVPQARHTLCTHAGRIRLWAHGPPPVPSQARHTLCTHVSTRGGSSICPQCVSLTRSVHTQVSDTDWGHGPPPVLPSQARHTLWRHTQGGYALWAHGYPPCSRACGEARHTLCTGEHCGHTGLLQCSPVRLATRPVHTQGGYALWAHGPPPAPQSGSSLTRPVHTVRILPVRCVQSVWRLWAHGPPPAPQSGSPHALYTRREDTHCGHTGLLQLPSQARHTLCTHAGRIRTVGTRASSSSPVRLATRSVHTQGGYALWAHGPPPAPQSGSPHALYTRREDTHCGHTGLLQLPSQARHTLCTHAGRIRTVSTRASSSPVRLATRSVHTQGGYAL